MRWTLAGASCIAALLLCVVAPARADQPADADARGDAAPRPGDVLEGGYRIERELGRGSTARVFAAVHEATGQRVALKWSLYDASGSGEVVRRLQREYAAASRIDHPSVIHVQALGRDRGHVFLVMELLDGEPLSARIARGPMGVAEAVRALLPAMEGIAAGHAAGIVHRDIKPDNIFLLRDGTPEAPHVRVIDFGLSLVHPDDVDLHLTQPGTVLGTPLYMAPEQIRSPHRADARADVYAFGVVLYEMLTQDFPIMGDSYQDFLVRLATAAPMPLRRRRADVPRELERIVMKAIARRPEERYPDLQSLRDALAPYAQEGYGADAGVPAWWTWAGAALALGSLLGFVLFLLLRRP
jgi:serine/threonine-protein kinase